MLKLLPASAGSLSPLLEVTEQVQERGSEQQGEQQISTNQHTENSNAVNSSSLDVVSRGDLFLG